MEYTKSFQETLDMLPCLEIPLIGCCLPITILNPLTAQTPRVIQENNMDVVEFAEQYGGSWLINGQTKILAGAEPQTSLSDEELYLNALNNIENHFLYVGLWSPLTAHSYTYKRF